MPAQDTGRWRRLGDSRVLPAVVHGATALAASAYPLSIVLNANIGAVPIDWAIVVRVAAVTMTVTAVLLLVARAALGRIDGAAAWLTWLFLISPWYGYAAGALAIEPRTIWFATGYVVAAGALVTLAVRPWRDRRRDPVPLLIVVAVLVGFNLYGSARQLLNLETAEWTAATGRLTEATPLRAMDGQARPDIFYLVLDGFGRPDTLARYYDLRLDDFVTFLEAQGFYVPAKARSNYAQTFLSLASALNLGYLDDLSAGVHPNRRTRPFLGHLIQQNRLMTAARQAGYTTVAVGSDYLATTRIAAADVCVCGQAGLDVIEQAVIAATPLAALPLDRWTYDVHRAKVLDAFAELETGGSPGRPMFVFAHIIAPHPPFVFAPDGSERPPAGLFSFADGSHFRGSDAEYVTGYRDQVRFVTSRLRGLIEALAARSGPPPAMIIHGDHGPGSMLEWEDVAATNLAERMNIFAAYRLPGAEASLYPEITPVNGARLLANQYFGAALPLLPDVSLFSTWRQPMQFIAVPMDDTP